jgi:alpha-amylase/alpha-mannosidase (GH57 family)
MIHVAFAFNFNIQRCEIEVGDEERIIIEGYIPLIDTLLKYGMKADFFFSGFSSELILEMKPELIERIKENLDTSFELGTYTYTHPIVQLLEPAEFSMQISRGLEIDREIFGRRTVGFLPPEMAFSRSMSEILAEHGIEWTIVLASRILGALPAGKTENLYKPWTVKGENYSLTAVPAVYQLPDTPARFLKRMMKGEIPVDTVVKGVEAFAANNPGALLLFKRDAETVFIDRFNSGFENTDEVFDEFLKRLSENPDIKPITIGDFIKQKPPTEKIDLPDFLGNTKVETFTEGEAKPIWDLTKEVRRKILELEAVQPDSENLKKAWEHLLLSHNSDGRIGYWFSEWNPGEHEVAPSRRKFIEDNLAKALEYLE